MALADGGNAQLLARGSRSGQASPPDPATVAWLVAVPCALATIALVVLLGPPLSELLYPARSSWHFLPLDPEPIAPEPVEGTRYLLALAAPVLLALATVVAVRRTRRISARRARSLAVAVQAAGAILVVACLVEQHTRRWGNPYFGMTALVVAAAIAAVVAVALRRPAVRRLGIAWTRDTPRRRIALLTLAAALTAIWVLPGVNSEASITWAILAHDTAFPFDEAAAILNGLTPWVDFNTQYAALFPFLVAPAMLAAGKTVLVFTGSMCALTAVVLLAVYGVFRRAVGSSLGALLLYVPFVPMSLFAFDRTVVRFSPGVNFPIFPLRYGGPYLLAWLLARKLGRAADERVWALFLAAGLVVLNNLEFGVPALAGTVAALIWTGPRRPLRLAADAALGLGAAYALYAGFALARSGGLPDPLRAAEFARLYGVAGYSVAPLPGVVGLPLVIFLTYVAALGTATVRALRHAPNRVLTGMLAWSGVFGFGSATYYVARSSFSLLPIVFSAWALALLLLTVPVVRRLAADPPRRPGVAALAVLFAFALFVCSLAQLPTPWSQLARLQAPPAEASRIPSDWAQAPSQDPAVRTFVASIGAGAGRFVVRPGAPIAVFATTGHRIADAYDAVDVVPYTGPESIHTTEQLEESFDALLDAGGDTALVRPAQVALLRDGLLRRGFALLTGSGPRRAWQGDGLPGDTIVVAGLTKWLDLRHPRATWLRGHS